MENIIFSGNLKEDSRIIISIDGEWCFTGTGINIKSENFRAKARIIKNMNVPGWIKKAVSEGKAVKISKVEKADENYYVVRGEVLETTSKRVEESKPHATLECSLNGESENPRWLCLSSVEEARKLKFSMDHRICVEWKEVILVGEDELGTKDSGYSWVEAGIEDVTSQYLPRVLEKLNTLDSDYFKSSEREKYTPMGEAGLKVEVQTVQPFVRLEIFSSDNISMRKEEKLSLEEGEKIIPLKDKTVGEEYEIHTIESYISGGDGFRRGGILKCPVTQVVADVTYTYENGMSFKKTLRLR